MCVLLQGIKSYYYSNLYLKNIYMRKDISVCSNFNSSCNEKTLTSNFFPNAILCKKLGMSDKQTQDEITSLNESQLIDGLID